MEPSANHRHSSDEYMKSYNVIYINDIAFEGHTSKEFKFGRFVMNDRQDGIVSHVFDVFRPITKLSPKFIKYFIHDEAIMQKPLLFSTSNARMLNSLNVGELNNQILSIPSIKEQEKIGKIINVTEFLIAANQDKINQLKQLKKLLMQKIFSQEWRFKGFTDPWEQRKLGDVVKFYSGLTYHPDDVQDKGTLVIRSSNIQSGQIVSADNVYVDTTKATSTTVKIGDIITVVRNGSRSLIGKHALVRAYSKHSYVIGAFMTGIRSNQPQFINALLDSTQFSIEIRKNLGATINQITTGNFKKMTFNFPNSSEQQEIGMLFSNIDSLIAANQKKVDQLKQLKKYLMQNMFV